MRDEAISDAARDLGHLVPWAQRLALLPAAERIAYARADRWIGYAKARAVVAKLEDLYTYPVRHRMPNLLILGPTNNGKTMIVEKFRRLHQPAPDASTDTEEWPVVVVQMPSDPTVTRFYSLLLSTLNAPVRPRTRLADLETLALRVLRAVKVRILVVDELHNILAGRGNAQREFLNLIRFLGNQLGIPIVCVGTKEAYYAVRSDDQLENRFEPMTLPPWQDDAEYASLLASFGAVLPLHRLSHLDAPDVARFILDKSEGTIGEIASLLTKAAVFAIESGAECIDKRVLLAANYESPSERRRLVERELL